MRGHAIRAAALAGTLALGGAAWAGASGDEEGAAPDGPVTGAAVEDGRYALRVLYQPECALNHPTPHIDVLFGTQTGRSWVLRHTKMPGSHEQGYVRVVNPFSPKPEPAPGN